MALAGMRKQPAEVFSRLAWQAVDWLYPPFCSGCGAPGTSWCPVCRSSLHLIAPPTCPCCGIPAIKPILCDACQNNPPPFTCLRSVAVYEGAIRRAILRLKFHQDIRIGGILSEYLVILYDQLQWPVQLILPVPLSSKRMRERGYNQASLLARPIAAKYKVAFKSNALYRTRNTHAQVGLSFDERQKNVSRAFQADPKWVKGKNVLLVDDVSTTGATLSECTKALLEAGAAGVYAVTLTRAVLHDDTYA